MSTPCIPELKLFAKNNEAINVIRQITKTVNKVEVPVDITGWEFFSQARATKDPESALICEITISIYGDPLEGYIKHFVDENIVKTLSSVRGFYDVLYRKGPNEPIDNLYMAPFHIEKGISVWPT